MSRDQSSGMTALSNHHIKEDRAMQPQPQKAPPIDDIDFNVIMLNASMVLSLHDMLVNQRSLSFPPKNIMDSLPTEERQKLYCYYTQIRMQYPELYQQYVDYYNTYVVSGDASPPEKKDGSV